MNRRKMMRSMLSISAGFLAGCGIREANEINIEVINRKIVSSDIYIILSRESEVQYEAQIQVPPDSAKSLENIVPPDGYRLTVEHDGASFGGYISVNECQDPKAYISISSDGDIRIQQRRC